MLIVRQEGEHYTELKGIDEKTQILGLSILWSQLFSLIAQNNESNTKTYPNNSYQFAFPDLLILPVGLWNACLSKNTCQPSRPIINTKGHVYALGETQQ